MNEVAQEEVEQVGTELDTVRHFGKELQQEKMEGRKAIRSGDSAWPAAQADKEGGSQAGTLICACAYACLQSTNSCRANLSLFPH